MRRVSSRSRNVSRGVQRLIERYRGAGLQSISHDFYPGGRHEMLNEINRGEVQARLLSWISVVLKSFFRPADTGGDLGRRLDTSNALLECDSRWRGDSAHHHKLLTTIFAIPASAREGVQG